MTELTERKVRVVVAKPGLFPEGGYAPLPEPPPTDCAGKARAREIRP